MVGKLLKHDFIALGRIILPTGIAVLVFALLSSLSGLISNGNVTLLQALLTAVFGIGVTAIFILSYVVCVKHFYDSVFSRRGYLTLALPVTPMQLLFSKVLVSFVAILFSCLVAVGSLEIYGLVNGVEIVGTLVNGIVSLLVQYQIEGGWIIYLLVYFPISAVCSLFFMFACVAAGQLVNKHRFALSAGVFVLGNWIFNLLTSLLNQIILTGSASLAEAAPYFVITVWLAESIILGVGSVFFIRYILRNKVNLLS